MTDPSGKFLLRALMLISVELVVARPSVAQRPPSQDSLLAVWVRPDLTTDERAKALSYILYADTTAHALEDAWALLGRGAAEPQDPLWKRALAADASAPRYRRFGRPHCSLYCSLIDRDAVPG